MILQVNIFPGPSFFSIGLSQISQGVINRSLINSYRDFLHFVSIRLFVSRFTTHKNYHVQLNIRYKFNLCINLFSHLPGKGIRDFSLIYLRFILPVELSQNLYILCSFQAYKLLKIICFNEKALGIFTFLYGFWVIPGINYALLLNDKMGACLSKYKMKSIKKPLSGLCSEIGS